ncbi:MAG: fumarate/nitrate reduction transcriptional regulator Fnr [Spongiibacteraceae bacterium]
MNSRSPANLAVVSEQHCQHNFQVTCSGCRLSRICLPIALEAADIEKLDSIIQRGRPLQKGEYLFRQNDVFRSVYAVRSGSLKSYSTASCGTEQVTAFYLPGEILGMDGIGAGKHLSSAIALETAAVCEMPFELLGELSTRVPKLQRHFFQLMSQEIAADQQLIAMLSKNSADQRVAALLINLSARNFHRKLSATLFRLPMSRAEMGNYLGLTVETMSRVFGRLQKSGIIKTDGREVEILSPDLLRDTAAGSI